MYIIKKNPYENGSRPPIQTWQHKTLPEGYAVCPDEFYLVFYSTTPAGFVNIELDDDVVTAMEVNQEALDAYIASLPEPEPAPEPEPTTQDETDAILVDHEYRITLLELGV